MSETINEKSRVAVEDSEILKGDVVVLDKEIQAAPALDDSDDESNDDANAEHIIITGADASKYLLSMRDDHEPALTFRSIFLASALSCFQAVMNQIYQVSQLVSTCGS